MNKRLTTSVFRLWCRLTALVMVLFCCCGPLGAQRGFEKAFGGPKEDFGSAIFQTKDHGYLEVGSSQGQLGDDNDFDIYVIRTDVDGTTIWERSFDEGFLEQASDAIETFDGAYFVVGYRKATPASSEESYLLKMSRRGELLFTKGYGEAGSNERARHIIRIPGGDYLITGYRRNAEVGTDDILLTRIDDEGETLWRQTIGGLRNEDGIGAVATEDGGFIIGANVEDRIGADSDVALIKVDAKGEVQWTKTYGTPTDNEQIEDIIRTSDGQLAFVGSTDNSNKALIAKANLNGDTLWYHEIDAAPFEDELRGLIEEDEGENLVAVGQTVPTGPNLDVLMVKVRSQDGQLIWQRRLGDEATLDAAEGIAPTVDGGYAIAAFSTRSVILFSDMSLYKTDDFGDHRTNYLGGRVYYPAGNDCGDYQSGDLGLEGWLVRAESDAVTFFGSTDSLGNYGMRVDTGVYTVSLLRKNDRWLPCREDSLVVDLTAPYDSSVQDFPVAPAIDCPLLEVNLSATPAISCRQQTMTVSYGNQGSVVATEVSIDVELADELGFLSANLEGTVTDQGLRFFIGDLAPGQSGTITLELQIACNAVRGGQAIGARAVISPIYDCSPVDPDWDGSSIQVTSRCDVDSGPSFTITNVGQRAMLKPSNYVVVEDILLSEQGSFILNINESIEVAPPAEPGATYRLIAEQSAGHPGALFPTAVEEGCVQDADGNFTTGRVAQFPDNDGDLHLDILTQEIVVLEDTAQLQMTAYPRGYQDSLIIPETDIEYTVFFSLPGNENIERVVIRDDLPKELLDLNSLEMGAASHPYDFVLQEDGILKITFDSIRIFSDGSAGEADAAPGTGYVSFRLSQKPNNSTGAVIRNRAAVYFDYQTPVFTPEVRHVVGCKDLLKEDGCLLPTSSRNLLTVSGVTTIINPNPVAESTTVQLRGWDRTNDEVQLRLFDAAGRPVRTARFRGASFELRRQTLPAGTYFYEVSSDNFFLGSGNIILK